MTKYGVDCILKSPEIKEKIKKRNMDIYGVDYPFQNAEFSEKNYNISFKKKEYKFSCGNILTVQGYEHFLLNILLNYGFEYNDIKNKWSEVPEIWYYENDKRRRYYCDFYLEKNNTICEVKSDFTYKIAIDNIKLKKEACEKAGYEFLLFIFDRNGNIINDILIPNFSYLSITDKSC